MTCPKSAPCWPAEKFRWPSVRREIGKSLFVLKLALALAADRPALVGEKAFEASQLGDVIFVSNEDDVRVVQQRVAAEKQAANLSAADFTRRQVRVSGRSEFQSRAM